MECGAGVWPRPWYRPLEEGEEGIDVAATTMGSWELAVRRPVCSVCSGRAAEPKYILLGRPRKVRPEVRLEMLTTADINILKSDCVNTVV